MDPRSPSDSDAGGGGRRDTPPRTDDALPDPGLTVGQLPHARAVLSLDRIRITGSCNEYTEGPAVPQRSPASEHRQQKSDLVTSPGSRTSGRSETPEGRPDGLQNLPLLTHHGNTKTSIPFREAVLQSPGAADSQGSIRTSAGSASSSSPRLHIIRTQPKCSELSSEELKPLHRESGAAVAAVPGGGKSKRERVHSKCEDCGRCRCPECRRPQELPSCWLCGGRCVCSPRSAVELGTCACCVRALFYHCSSDREDTACVDKPFSCGPPHCCVRWAAVSLCSLLLPCLLCYPPAMGCVSVCRSCYDGVTRPGCRC